MKKTEMHCHTAPISCCAQLGPRVAAERYHKCGFNAILLTNHYSRTYFEHYGVTDGEWRKLYYDSYLEFRDECEKRDMEAFFGAEVTLFAPYNEYFRERYSAETLAANYADYILIGMTKEFFFSSPLLCDLDVQTLHKVCSEAGVLAVQAHPFRTEQSHALRDMRYADGLEINSNIAYPTGPNEERILSLARENDKIVICGGDTHYAWHKLVGATFVPDDVHDATALAAHLRNVRIPRYSLTEDDPFAAPRPEKK